MISGSPLPAGWTGKLWAMQQGVAEATAHAPTYFLFTDADIVYAPDALTRLVAQAEAKQLVLTSLDGEAALRECRSSACSSRPSSSSSRCSIRSRG